MPYETIVFKREDVSSDSIFQELCDLECSEVSDDNEFVALFIVPRATWEADVVTSNLAQSALSLRKTLDKLTIRGK